ncbi:ATP-binding cassette transporter [Mycena kentingensis (nom. inval.)]|nr:ATP-binding cassette transporter [Mycena kentingensis (nom. inval.)]
MQFAGSAQAVLAPTLLRPLSLHLPDLPGSDQDEPHSRYLLLLPAYATVLSGCVLLFQHLFLPLVRRIRGVQPTPSPPVAIGKGAILVWRIARVLGSIALLAVSIASCIKEASSPATRQDWLRGLLVNGPYLYATLLALPTLSPSTYRQSLVRHANFVLFAAFALYAYRDIVPLATFTRDPLDLDDALSAATFGLVCFVGAVVPLFTPRLYIPIDPENPQTEINPEQTAPIIDFALYFFLDKIIFSAYRQSQLPEDELYPLCDTDRGAVLKERSFKHIDTFSGAKPRYLFFGLMRVYWREFSSLAVLIILRSVSNYAGPFAMNRLLEYIETREQVGGHVVRPWVWIFLVGIGPVLGSLAFQYYIFINTRTLVRTESIITQLVFAHSLRIRVKAETTDSKEKEEEAPTTPAVEAGGSDTDTITPENAAESVSASESSPVNPSSEDEGESTVQPSSASVKSASSSVKKGDKKKDEKAEKDKKAGSLTGKINNLVTTDLCGKYRQRIVDSRDFLVLLIYVPTQLAIGIYFLYVLLGWSVWVGLASIVLLAPLPGYMAKLVQKVQKERLKHTDERVSSVSEAVNVLRMVKLFGWEPKMQERIKEKREDELTWIRKRRVLDLASSLVKYASVFLLGTRLTVISQLYHPHYYNGRHIWNLLTGWINNLIQGKVSLDRTHDFLRKTELLDEYEQKETPALFVPDPATKERIGFRNATFAWSKETDGAGARSRSQRQFQLKIDGEVIFAKGKINLVVGPTGSGKTSLLMALLGEMHFIPSSPDSWYNLPRADGVAYAAQESWVLNETIRDNITFDTPYDEERYKKVLYQCALEQDLALFQAGDKTEVGEKGLTLSGGQKARLTLARAVYSKASVILLDDILAALDVHTSQWIVEKLFFGDLIEGRTIILVTHNIALTQPVADYIVTFGADGHISATGSISEISKRGSVAAQIQAGQDALDKKTEVIDPKVPEDNKPKSSDGKLIVAEEIEMGHISAKSRKLRASAFRLVLTSFLVKMYLGGMGGKHPITYFTLFYFGLFLNQAFVAIRTWQLGYWAKQYDDRPASEVDVVSNLTVFTIIVTISTTLMTIVYVYLVYGQLRASRVIHMRLIDSILRAPLRWLDVTPVSRIIARVTNDIRAVDDSLPNQFWPLSAMLISMTVRFGAILIYAPIFFFPGVAVGALGAWVGQIYISGQLPVKRLMSNTRAPVLAHFGAAIAGLVSIRAFGAQEKFNTESVARIDRYTRAARNYYNLNRWVSIRVDILGGLFASSLAAYLVYISPASAGDTGFLLNMAVTFTQMLLWVVRILNEFEVQGNSLERIQGYVAIEHEKPASEDGKPPAYWPASGELVVENLTARYSDDSPDVLHGISFTVKAGERVGIVGRTGSGKSSLTLSLLRCIPTDGSIRYDGLDTSKLNLDALRSSITIIPQVPELLQGTLRSNLDPFDQYDDAELNSSLRAAGLFALQSEMDEGRITLDSAISAGGSNLSVGQRQIFALARAIVRKSKILILDEATSAIDYKTDSIIQNSLRKELSGDVSLLTVAHRLQTIMDADKIMVLDAGKIVEYDSPKELLKIEGGKLRALVDESGDRDVLYEMAGDASKSS